MLRKTLTLSQNNIGMLTTLISHGRQWTAYLRERVAELAPITGIEPGDPAPQRVWSR